MKHKFQGDPAPSGKGGVKRVGETSSTKKALAHANSEKAAAPYGRKK